MRGVTSSNRGKRILQWRRKEQGRRFDSRKKTAGRKNIGSKNKLVVEHLPKPDKAECRNSGSTKKKIQTREGSERSG